MPIPTPIRLRGYLCRRSLSLRSRLRYRAAQELTRARREEAPGGIPDVYATADQALGGDRRHRFDQEPLRLWR